LTIGEPWVLPRQCKREVRRAVKPPVEFILARHGREAFEIVRSLIEQVRIIPADGRSQSN
jgi:hypothetical protein